MARVVVHLRVVDEGAVDLMANATAAFVAHPDRVARFFGPHLGVPVGRAPPVPPP